MTARRAIAPGEYYHIYNRAAHRRTIFRDNADYQRMLFALCFAQSPVLFQNTSRISSKYSGTTGFPVSESVFQSILAGRTVELVAFCLMPNHFHIIVRGLTEDGIARYMQRVGDGYTRYFEIKYQTAGHVFEGPYKSVHIKDDVQLLHTSAYIHRNPREIKGWRNREARYPWSSYQDYVEINRFGGLLAQEIILDQFAGTRGSNYADFVKTSPAKI